MKSTTILIAFASISLAVSAQDLPYTVPFTRTEVVDLDSTMSADAIYSKAERWFVDAFKDADEVIQLRDSESNTIVAKGIIVATWAYNGFGAMTVDKHCNFTMEVQAKDGRYRVRVYGVGIGTTSITVDEPCCFAGCEGGGKKFQEAQHNMCSQIKFHINDLLISLNRAMKSAPKDDW